MAKDEGGGKSIIWVIAMVMVLVLAGAWVYAASDYFQNQDDGPNSRGMWENAIAQLPNMPAVIGYTFKNRIWLPIVVVMAEALTIGLGMFMKKVERDLNSPRRR